MAVAGDVPGRFDVVINGEGYVFASEEERAAYGFTPTFVARTHIQGDYGDEAQDFWMTLSQNDWSGGEGQRFYRSDEQRRNRFWSGSQIEVSEPGQVLVAKEAESVSWALEDSEVVACLWDSDKLALGYVTNLATVSGVTQTDRGAHGVGALPTGIASDGVNVFLTAPGASGGVRKWSSAGGFVAFSASPADSLAYLNNTLYGLRQTNGDLVRWDTAGALTSLFTWQEADGSALADGFAENGIVRYGGKLLILRKLPTPSLWMYDGTAPAMIAEWDSSLSFDGRDALTVSQGVVFIAGTQVQEGSSYGVVYFYVNGTLGLLWRSGTSGSTRVAVAPWKNGVAIFDAGRDGHYYDIPTGSIYPFLKDSTGTTRIASAGGKFYVLDLSTFAYPGTNYPATASQSPNIVTSLFDADSSLTKLWRGIKVEYDQVGGANSNVDVYYRLNDVDSTYTLAQQNVTSGTEVTLTGVSSRSISVKIVFNTNLGAEGVRLKRIHVRAAPLLSTFKRRQYVVSCTGKDGEGHPLLRDGTFHPKDGLAQATDLNTAATATAPFSITDRFGTFTGIIEPDGYELKEIRPEEFLALVKVREV